MAKRVFYNLAAGWSTTLSSSLAAGATSAVINTASNAEPAVPFKMQIDSERIIVTAVADDTPSAGKQTLTITRGADGTSDALHNAAAAVKQLASAFDMQYVMDRLDKLESCVVDALGGAESDGVLRTSRATDLKVVAQGTPDMTVKVNVGGAMVSGEPSYLATAYDTATITAPSGNPRIDVVEIDQAGDINVVTGSEAGSPSAPSVSAGALKLAEIYHRVGSTSIKNTDDASNSYITDSRVFV